METQDSAAQISRMNRGFRTPPQVDDFLQGKNITINYDANGNISSLVMTKDIAGMGTKTKTLTFGYATNPAPADAKPTSITTAIT